MKYTFLFFLVVFFISCGNEKELQLPQIDKADITELLDVSAAYLFYDETQPDSVLLNRKNLISTTNWLVNVDKRLTLKQAIPHIKFLQEKKQNSSHKNEKAKNYFTCHDLNRNNLGFIEFTGVKYTEQTLFINYVKTSSLKKPKNQININFNSSTIARLINMNSDSISRAISKNELIMELKEIDSSDNIIYLDFNANLQFQDYIQYKSIILKADVKEAKISSNEYVYN